MNLQYKNAEKVFFSIVCMRNRQISNRFKVNNYILNKVKFTFIWFRFQRYMKLSHEVHEGASFCHRLNGG